MALFVRMVAGEQFLVASVGGSEGLVGDGAEVVFDFGHVARREAPVVVAEIVETRETVTFDTAGKVNVSVEITPHQVA